MSTSERIAARVAELDRLQSEIDVERAELKVALRVLERFNEGHDSDHRERVVHSNSRTNRDFFISALSESGSPWLTANEIQELASAIKGSSIPMSSVSPELTNMKNAGLIERDGLKVALVGRAKKEEGPAFQPAP